MKIATVIGTRFTLVLIIMFTYMSFSFPKLQKRRKALEQCETRHQQLLQIEDEVREIFENFYDIALFAEEHGENVDIQEYNLELLNEEGELAS